MVTPTTKLTAAIAALALVGLVVSVAAAWPRLPPESPVRETEPGPPVAASSVPPSPTTPSPASPRAAGEAVPAEAAEPRPVRIAVPSIDLAARVRPVGVAPNGQMSLPPDPRVLGWYRFGPVPSQQGSTVLAGHLDSLRYGLGPLVRLRDLAVGGLIVVTTEDRSTTTYSVEAIDRFDRQGLPDQLFARSGPRRLRIITCGGDYDASAGGYEQNLVVSARPL